MSSISPAHVGVIGAGLIGGSICKALRSSGHDEITVYSPSQATIEEVKKSAFATASTVAEIVAVADVLFVCVPLTAQQSVFVSIADAVRGLDRKNLVVTDVSSVKGAEARHARELFDPIGVTFLAGHPMAGTEESGFGASSHDMFDGATWVLCPEGTPVQHVFEVVQLIVGMNAKVSLLDIDTHDRAVAAVSHLPYVLAATLMNSLPDGDEQTLAMRLAAGSFRDGSRVASSEPWLSASMLTFNSSHVRQRLNMAIGEMSRVLTALEQNDQETVREFFESAQVLRSAYSTLKSSKVVETVSLPAKGAIEALMKECRAGSLIREVTASHDGWDIALER